MYRYIECNRIHSEEHFKKFAHLDEIKNYIDTLNVANWHKEALKDGTTEDYPSYGSDHPYISDVRVYRIKDISDAINTSVLLDISQKEDYLKMLSDQSNEFDADVDFLEICENVGECDIY